MDKPKRNQTDDKLHADPTALERWRNLPHNEPSKQALPPATGGYGLSRRWILLFVIFGIVAVINFLPRLFS